MNQPSPSAWVLSSKLAERINWLKSFTTGFVAPPSQIAADMFPRRASPSRLFRENRTPRNFKTGS